MPVRHIGLCYRSVGGRVPMGRGNPMVRVESTLERDFALLQRFDPDVLSLEEQPVRIAYRPSDGKRRSYLPDFLVRYRSSSQSPRLVEVKYTGDPDLLSGALDERFAAARVFASDRGWSFDVATDADIRTPYLSNVTFLLPYRTRAAEPVIKDRLSSALYELGPQTVQSLVDHVASGLEVVPEQVLAALWMSVAKFELSADLRQPLSMNSLVRLPEEDGP